MCRNFYARITSKRARRRPFVDVEMLQDIPPEVDRINGVLEACEQKLDSMFGKDGWPEPLPYWGKIVRFLRGCRSCVFTTDDALSIDMLFASVIDIFVMVMALDELEAAIIKELSGNVSSQRLYILQQAMEQLQLRTMEELKAKVGWQPKPGSARILATIDGLMAFFSVLRMRRIFKLPSLEEGGCRGSWTMEEKLINAQCEYNAMRESSGRLLIVFSRLHEGLRVPWMRVVGV